MTAADQKHGGRTSKAKRPNTGPIKPRDEIDILRRAFEVAEELAKHTPADNPMDEEQRLFPPIRDAMQEAYQAGRNSRSIARRVKQLFKKIPG